MADEFAPLTTPGRIVKVKHVSLAFECSAEPTYWPGSAATRNTVPSTLVLDQQHNVAAVFLTAVRVPEPIPVVERQQAEPPQAA